MVDLAQVGFEADSDPLKKASDALDDLKKAAGDAAVGVDDFNKGVTESSTATGKMQSSVDRLLGPLSSMKGLIAGIFGGFSLSLLGNMADSWSDVSSRVGVAIGDMEGASSVMDRLANTARLTYSSLNSTSEAFVRNSTVLQALGKSTDEQIKYTEALNLALVASGTKGQAALSVQEALAKGMTNGKLATEQLQTVMNNSSEVTKALAAELGTTTLGLTAFAREGKITSEVIFNTLTKRLDEFTQKAADMPATLGDGFLLIGNAITVLVGTLDGLSGATSFIAELMVKFSDGIMWVAQNLDTVVEKLIPIAPAMIVAFGPTILGMVTSLATAFGVTLFGAIQKVYLLLLANPLTAFAAGVALVIGYVIDWETALQKAIETFGKFAEAWYAFWGNEEGKKWAIDIQINADKAVAELKNQASNLYNKVKDGITGGGEVAAATMKGGIEDGGKTAAQYLQDSAQDAVSRFEEMNGKLTDIIVKSHKTGAEYTYNAYTGAVKESTGTVKASMQEGGSAAGDTIEKAMVSGGQKAGATIYNSVESAFASLAHLSEVFEAFYRRERAELAKLQAETAKNYADAEKARAEAELTRKQATHSNWGGNGSGSGGSGSSSRGGGGGTVGFGGGGWNDPFYNPNAQPQQPGETKVQTTTEIKNVVDPNMMIDAMDTSQGHSAIINVIKYNREELRALLGST